MTCTAHLGDPNGLGCTRDYGHDFGHVFVSTSGVPDAHAVSSHE